jgi:hypothetical protein
VEIRIAVPSDEAAILALIRVAAAAIPILVEPDDRWRLVQSWVAVGNDGAV